MTNKERQIKEHYFNKITNDMREIMRLSNFNSETCGTRPSIDHNDITVFAETFLRVHTVLQIIKHEFMTINVDEEKEIEKVPVVGTSLETRLRQILLSQQHIYDYEEGKAFFEEISDFETYFLKTDLRWLLEMYEKEQELLEVVENFSETESFDYFYAEVDLRRCREIIKLLESASAQNRRRK